MKHGEWLELATKRLGDASVATARLDCLVLLEDATGQDRSLVLAHADEILSDTVISLLEKWIIRRVNHEPLAYIRGKSEFYGRDFMVTPDTLEPRPETETMIDLLKLHLTALIHNGPLHIVDVGTGSGCLAVTTKKEFTDVCVAAVDISPACTKIAKQNAKTHAADVHFHTGDLLKPITSQIDLIVANLPYVPDEHTINQAAMFEPRLAIFGGADGLDLYRQMFEQISNMNHKPSLVLTESLPFQHKELTQIAKKSGYTLKTSEDFIQVFKTVG